MILDGSSSDLEATVAIIIIAAAVVLRLLMLGRANAMRARCPKCGTVFDMPFMRGPHLGPWRYGRCPSCDRGSLMRTGIKAPITWPDDGGKAEERAKGPGEQEELERRIRDSKYE